MAVSSQYFFSEITICFLYMLFEIIVGSEIVKGQFD